LNLAAEIETAFDPLELLNAAKAIERGLGRTPTVRWGPREIDIDLVLWGSRIVETESLVLPHKEFRTRAFVLVPLAEIAPDAVDPVTGLSVRELAGRPEAQGDVTKLGPFLF
jgi:2-amino-4-hydroxy-6-hydroxymethyldihydropteridine diphosphokinase